MGFSDDLARATQSLNQSTAIFGDITSKLKQQRVVEQANLAVQGIKESEESESNKRQLMKDLAQQITLDLAGNADAGTIKQITGAIKPEERFFQTAEQFLVNQPDFTEEEAKELLLKNKEINPLAIAKMHEQQSKTLDGMLARFGKQIDPTLQVRSSFGRAAKKIQDAEALEALIGRNRDFNELPPQQVRELVTGLAGMIQGGVPTEIQVEELAPKTLGVEIAQMKQWLTNGLAGANVGEFVNLYLKTVRRERAVANKQIEETVLRQAQANVGISKRGREAEERFRLTVSSRLGISPEDVIIDGNRVTTRQKEAVDSRVGELSKRLPKVFSALRSKNPATREDAKQALLQAGINSKDILKGAITLKQAQEIIEMRIRRGL